MFACIGPISTRLMVYGAAINFFHHTSNHGIVLLLMTMKHVMTILDGSISLYFYLPYGQVSINPVRSLYMSIGGVV